MSIPGWIRAALGLYEGSADRGLAGRWILIFILAFVLLVLLGYEIARRLVASW